MMNNHKVTKCLVITLPFTVGRVYQAVFLCVSYVFCHQVILCGTLLNLGLPSDLHSVFCSFVVS